MTAQLEADARMWRRRAEEAEADVERLTEYVKRLMPNVIFHARKRLVVECMASIPAPAEDWYRTGAHGQPVREAFQNLVFDFVVPVVGEPWDATDETEEAIIAVEGDYADKPMLSAQCIGGFTALNLLARRPDAYAGAVLHNPAISPRDMPDNYGARGRHKSRPEDFSKIAVPVHIWHGDGDKLAAWNDEIAASIPTLQMHWFEGNHSTAPDLLCEALPGVVKELYG